MWAGLEMLFEVMGKDQSSMPVYLRVHTSKSIATAETSYDTQQVLAETENITSTDIYLYNLPVNISPRQLR